MVAMVAWLPFWLFSTVDLATCSSCSSPCPLVADVCGRGAVDVALTSVSWSVASGARTQPCDPPLVLLLAKRISNGWCRGGEQERWGEAGLWRHSFKGMIVHTEPQAIRLQTYPLWEPLSKCIGFGLRIRVSVSASCGRTF